MTFFTEQRVLDNAPTTTLLNKINELLTEHPAWTRLQDRVVGVDTVRQYRCSGTANGTGKDFVLSLTYTTASAATSTVFVVASEDIDANGALLRPCPTPVSQFTPSATYAAVADNTAYAANSTTANRLTMFATTNTTDFTYWIVVTNRGFWLRSSLDTYTKFAGLFQPFWTHPQEYPLCVIDVGNPDADGAGSFSRRPSESGKAGLTDTFALDSALTVYSALMGTIPNPSSLYDKAYGARNKLDHGSAAVDNGKARGLMYDCLLFSIDAAVAVGDTLTVDGKKYLCIQDATTIGLFVNTEAA